MQSSRLAFIIFYLIQNFFFLTKINDGQEMRERKEKLVRGNGIDLGNSMEEKNSSFGDGIKFLIELRSDRK